MWIQLLGPKPPKGALGEMVLISLGILSFILWYFCDLPFQTCPEHHSRASNKRFTRVKPRDACIQAHGGLEFNYTLGATTTFQFNLCDVINCGNNPAGWRGYDAYLCADPVVQIKCHEKGTTCDWFMCENLCEHWGLGVAYTGFWTPTFTYGYTEQAQKVTLVRQAFTQRTTGGVNPLLLTMKGLSGGLFPQTHYGNKQIYFTLGVDITG
ncbi:hypothetical protein GOODEAATRI_033130 [Goodea atripinnis]|uniref:Uncharacterized protein n=1 Tax=Goodea atripinnis TaxID=208336 RepID=A0ABV0N669_9TELE